MTHIFTSIFKQSKKDNNALYLRHYLKITPRQMIKITAPLLAEYYKVSTRTVKRKSAPHGGLKTVNGVIQTIIALEEKKQKKPPPSPPLKKIKLKQWERVGGNP